MGACSAKDCKRSEPLGAWARRNGLETRHQEADKQHASRCLAFMAVEMGRKLWCSSPGCGGEKPDCAVCKGTTAAVQRMAEAAGVDEITMHAAIDERRAWIEREDVTP